MNHLLTESSRLSASLDSMSSSESGPSHSSFIFNDGVTLENGPHIHNAKDDHIIMDVWESNFEEELKKLMILIEKYKIIGMVSVSLRLLISVIIHFTVLEIICKCSETALFAKCTTIYFKIALAKAGHSSLFTS